MTTATASSRSTGSSSMPAAHSPAAAPPRAAASCSRANELKRLRAALDTLTLEKKQCEAELEDAQTALDTAHAQLDTAQAQLEQAVETLHKSESEAAQVALLKNAAQETIAGQNASIDACRAQQKANQDRITAARADAAFGGAGARPASCRARSE